MDVRNKYISTDIKWIVAQRVSGSDWAIKYLGTGDDKPELLTDDGYIHPVIDNCPAFIRDVSEFAIFRNREDWWKYKPYILSDWRDKSSAPIKANFDFINHLDASWF